MTDELEALLYGCLASRRWAHAVASGEDPDRAMDALTDEEWLAAMKAHPRIGERGGEAPKSSDLEQRRAMAAPAATLDALAAENRRYEERFGRVFLIFASDRGGEEILSELRRRMGNDHATELEESKRELRKIARLRVERVKA